jgi:hypothetical protein
VIQAGHEEKKHGRGHRRSRDSRTQKWAGQTNEHEAHCAYPFQRDKDRDTHTQTSASSGLEERRTSQEERRNQYEGRHTTLPDQLVHQKEIGEHRTQMHVCVQVIDQL